jgi:UTP-glucose-1-phosphate uridylyltransferase
MSRSDYIYVVQDEDNAVIAAFTVKHELESWLKHHRRADMVLRVRARDQQIAVDRVIRELS